MEAWEFGLREVVLAEGAKLLQQLLTDIGNRNEVILCQCGTRMVSSGRMPKTIETILGTIELYRSRYVCPSCKATQIPADILLDVAGTKFSPGLRRLMARAGQRDTFKEGRDDLLEFAAITVTAKEVERVSEKIGMAIEHWHQRTREEVMLMPPRPELTISVLYICYDGTGVPMVPWETAGRTGKQADGSSKTREAKLGCVFTQTTVDEDGYPIRDAASTTFVGGIENSNDFGERIYAEALSRGLAVAQEVVILADGARYNWEIADLHFPGAIHIVDLFHAREHLHGLLLLVARDGSEEFKHLEKQWRDLLDEGKVEDIIDEALHQLPQSLNVQEKVFKAIAYFHNNAGRMRYRSYRTRGLFVGSGVIEAGCKTLIGKRLKQSGMEWTVRGANSIIALRCCHLSGRWEDFWETRAA